MTALTLVADTPLDAETYRLTQRLQSVLEGAPQGDGSVLSSLSRQLCDHLLARYRGAERTSGERAALSPWQEKRAKEILARSLHSRLLIADVAQQCAMSRSHFSRAFKKTTGLSPQEWTLDLRVRTAKQLLAEDRLSIAQVSLECGFADQAHFSRTFSRLVGMTPKHWRQLNREQARA
ncbi:helix-turn-helix transcriptional regulator [Metapseudomonas otitidis]|uniref:helix-turn-helix transcriptional regulator n=1 Tax=Metapseudomonas otitidis TaxID=319939 RepID=UPI003CF4DAD0